MTDEAMTPGPKMNEAVAHALGCIVGHTGGRDSRAFCACKDRTHGDAHSESGAWSIRNYSGSIGVAFEMEAELERRHLEHAYAAELGMLIEIRTNRQTRFDLIHASPIDRCKAALALLAAQTEAGKCHEPK